MKKAFVIGHPIKHSRSPLIHGSWLAEHGIDGSYEAIDVAPDALPAFIERLRQGEFVGGNVTIPHKEAVFALCDSVDPLARTIGAANTLVRQPDGRIHGFNTDYMGFLGNLDQNAPGWAAGLGRAVVLGAGGAARAILVALREQGVPEIVLLNRTPEKAAALAREIGGPFIAGGLTDYADYAAGAGLLVNTTSIGMHDTRFEALDLGLLPGTALVTDIVYVPLTTPLLADARALGLRTVDGLGMLLHQAVPGFAAWFGVRPEVTSALRAKVEATL
ncbi:MULTISPECIES: shikimate dehydrogenase [unclassified Devosia]|uniref:shikimate dehydrogenase n=1 Tax=unclassified Devosia TaxID=196773 RepID=UPI000869A6D6|nr:MULTISPECIES: shikimate dehydrogenase [unclassified Devosia]MBN9362271.1 shikimate dehydrogenase [Devosia sp.]ODS91376.1 MAG: shikimate dehydrogenase [Devosia sp. SCN 66-27]OJX24777.1 MAG: shikimate dehydrogenase [Devosia sp. 66-14]